MLPKGQMLKLVARSERVRDLFVTLRHRFEVLKPLAFDADLARRVGSGPRALTHLILRDALLESCVQDVIKISTDDHESTPSITNIMDSLAAPRVRQCLRDDYSRPPTPVRVGSGGSLPPNIEAALMQRERADRAVEFDEIWAKLHVDWNDFQGDVRVQAFQRWRDKIIAHSELQHSDGRYHAVDLGMLGLKWGDLGDVIGRLQQLIVGLDAVIRSNEYMWSELDRQLDEASRSFWATLGPTAV